MEDDLKKSDALEIDGKLFNSRLIMGTALFPNIDVLNKSIEISESEIITTSVRRLGSNQKDFFFDQIKKASMYIHKLRNYGSAALDFAYVASGRADFAWYDHLKYWDYAAGYNLTNRMPLWIYPLEKIDLTKAMSIMRSKYQQSWFDMTGNTHNDVGAKGQTNPTKI